MTTVEPVAQEEETKREVPSAQGALTSADQVAKEAAPVPNTMIDTTAAGAVSSTDGAVATKTVKT